MMAKQSKVQTVKNGFYKRWGSNSDFDKDKCPLCKIEMKDIADLYEEPNPEICVEWSEKKESMESRFYQCPKCKKIFVFWESGDYDYFYLQEVTIQNMISNSPKNLKSNFNPSSRRMGTEALRGLIPSWVSDSEVERIRKEFDPEMSFQELKDIMTKSSNWKRIQKFQNDKNSPIERLFDCKPLDDQLRLLVYTNATDTKVIKIRFQTE